VKLIANSNLPLHRNRVIIDDYLRVPDTKGRVFALGDCAVNPSDNLPPTATVAEQQAIYLSECMNKYYSTFDVLDEKNKDLDVPLPGNVTPALMPFASLSFLNKLLCKDSPKL
jgi:NADH:ubiquinone reductase (non-electrogenic)